MPFLICENCAHKYLSFYHETHGTPKLCYSCVQISKCTCVFTRWVSERCKRHYSTYKDRLLNYEHYKGKGLKYSVKQKYNFVNDELIVKETVNTLKQATLDCLTFNNVRVENSDEEYFYKKVITNFKSYY